MWMSDIEALTAADDHIILLDLQSIALYKADLMLWIFWLASEHLQFEDEILISIQLWRDIKLGYNQWFYERIGHWYFSTFE